MTPKPPLDPPTPVWIDALYVTMVILFAGLFGTLIVMEIGK
jgi:hypothetical protein